MTKGEYRVGVDFNPSGSDVVGLIKSLAARLIDDIEGIDDQGEGEIKRLKAEAQTGVETAAMWAVKAATKKPQEDKQVPVGTLVTDDLALARSMDDPNYQELVEEPKEE